MGLYCSLGCSWGCPGLALTVWASAGTVIVGRMHRELSRMRFERVMGALLIASAVFLILEQGE